MGHSQLLSHVLRTVSACMINLSHIYNVANLIQFINIDAQYRMRSAILRNDLKEISKALAKQERELTRAETLKSRLE